MASTQTHGSQYGISIKHLCFSLIQTEKKEFFVENRNRRWKVDLLRQSSRQKTMGWSRSVTISYSKTRKIWKKVMICVWWDQKGIIHYELLETNQTVTADLYSQQLTRLNRALESKWPFNGKGKRKVILLHDNAKPHVAKTTQKKIENLGSEVLPHPAYSPDLAPTDFHFFRSMQHFLSEKSYSDLENIKKDINQFFAVKPTSFYEKSIQSLPERWEKWIAGDANYFD